MIVKEKYYSKNPGDFSVGVANINVQPGEIEQNKKKILTALDLFTQKKANLVVFPEYCFTGSFWEPETYCRKILDQKGTLQKLAGWLEKVHGTYINKTLQYVIFNGLSKSGKSNGNYANTTIVLDRKNRCFDKDRTYKKTYLPGIEQKYTSSGVNDTLVLETAWGKLGFLTCFDICFPRLVQKLVCREKVDMLIVNAAWRKQGKREYKGLQIKEAAYYKTLWDMFLPSLAFQHQVWVTAANLVGPHSLDGLDYSGGSGIWAPSGIEMIKGSDKKEVLLILQNIDMVQEINAERKDFWYTGTLPDVDDSDI